MLRLTFFRLMPLICVALMAIRVTGQDFPKLYNDDSEVDASPMPAGEAASGFELPEGFRVDVFASEPEVQNPIAMTWDARGRMWVAENFTYAQRSQRFDLSLQDRLLIFEDTDGDGVSDKRTVFTDQVQMLTSVEVGAGGVWLMCPPQLLFIPDADQDDQPDGPATVVLDGFQVAKQNYHNYANGLKWGPDGWLYGRCGGSCPGRIGIPGTPDEQRTPLEGGIWRYHPQTTEFEVLCHGTTNPWGHDWDEFGDAFFINTVNGHLWHLIPGAHFKRPFSLDPNPSVYELIDMHADHWHFDTKGDWMKSRGGAAASFGGGHAHSGVSIYLGDNWPDEYRGRLLTLNFHGRRINQELLERSGSGHVGKHGSDMFIATDPFFRGIDLSYGPDGAVYVIDWSDTGECHEHTGVHRTSGRVYRISHEKADSAKQSRGSDLNRLTDEQLAEMMTHRNEWFVRMARRLLIDRSVSRTSQVSAATETQQSLRLMAEGSDPVVAYRALVTLYGMGLADTEYLLRFLDHSDEHLRAWGIRLLTDHWPIDHIMGMTPLSPQRQQRITAECTALQDRFAEVAAQDASGMVRLTLASTLQRMPISHRSKLAGALMLRGEDAGDHNLPLLVWYGLSPMVDQEPAALAELANLSKWPITQRLIARRLAEGMDEHPRAMEQLIEHATTANPTVRRSLLTGISEGLKGWSRAPQPKSWPKLVSADQQNADSKSSDMIRDLSVLFGDGRALDEVRKIVMDQDADIAIRRSSLKTYVESDDPKIAEICLTLLSDARLNVLASRGVAQSSSPESAIALIGNYYRFRAPTRPKVIELLVSRPTFAKELLVAIHAGRIPADELSAFDVRQIRSLDDPSLSDQITALWGEVRESPREKLEAIDGLKKMLTTEAIAKASPNRGRLLFNKNCMQCHKLFGQGESIGPDLTGANRTNLDFLLENIVDPSAVVGKDFTMTILLMEDGRVLNGLVVSKNEKTLRLQTQTELKTIELIDIEVMKQTTKSPMPDGLLDQMQDNQIQDLIAYLMQPTQVPLP